MRIFIDTNILIDFLSIRDKFYEDAKKIFTLGLLRKHELVISSLSIANAMYVAHKYGYENFKEGLQGLFAFLSVADYKGDYVKEALILGWKDYEDSTQFLSAIGTDCNCIVTRNKGDFEKSSLPVYSPKEFLVLPINYE